MQQALCAKGRRGRLVGFVEHTGSVATARAAVLVVKSAGDQARLRSKGTSFTRTSGAGFGLRAVVYRDPYKSTRRHRPNLRDPCGKSVRESLSCGEGVGVHWVRFCFPPELQKTPFPSLLCRQVAPCSLFWPLNSVSRSEVHRAWTWPIKHPAH